MKSNRLETKNRLIRNIFSVAHPIIKNFKNEGNFSLLFVEKTKK